MALNKPKPFMTVEEARAAGFEFADPEREKCEFCGKELDPIGVEGGSGLIFWISHTQCDCEGSRAYEEELKREQERKAERELHDRFIRAGVKKRFLDAKVDRPQLANYLNAFNADPSIGLYITGPSRAGKSYSASALAKAFVASGYSTVLTTSIAMLDDVKASFDGDARSGVSRFASCDVLIIDDLGKENANSWVMTTLFQIINERYESMRPTIVTTQYSLEELRRRMSRSGEKESAIAITERLRETCRLMTLPRRANVDLMKPDRSEP